MNNELGKESGCILIAPYVTSVASDERSFAMFEVSLPPTQLRPSLIGAPPVHSPNVFRKDFSASSE